MFYGERTVLAVGKATGGEYAVLESDSGGFPFVVDVERLLVAPLRWEVGKTYVIPGNMRPETVVHVFDDGAAITTWSHGIGRYVAVRPVDLRKQAVEQ